MAWLFSPGVGIVWLIVIVFSGLQAATNWGQITRHLEIIGFATYNYLLLFLLYPLIKTLHELGHAFATKLKGGEVHEMGLNFNGVSR